jgi:DNA-binding NarL/FixJ family response regulator
MAETLRILHLEDDPQDTELAYELLRSEGLSPQIDRISTMPAFRRALEQKGLYSLILSDYSMPGIDPIEAMRLARQLRPEVPFVFLSGTMGEETAIESLKMGANDYVLKQGIGRLVPAVRRALAEAEEQTRRRRAEDEIRRLNAELEQRIARRTVTLQQRTQQLQKLAIELSNAEDRERRRLAEILHDDLQQMLAAAKFHLNLLGNRVRHEPSQHAIVARIDHMLTDAIEKSRNLSHEISPAVLYRGSLTEALQWLAHQAKTKYGLSVTVETIGEVDAQSDAIRSFLYKAAQELLFNVAKHAQTKEATIRIRRLGPYISLVVCDQGLGFDPLKIKEATGFGLLTIRERAELLGGRMQIHSTIGKGSLFRIAVPADQKIEVTKRRTGEPAELPRSPILSSVGLPLGRTLRVLLVDDQKIVREGLALLLGEDPDLGVVGEAANGQEAVELTEKLHPDVVVMDVSMPIVSGDEATERIKARLPQTRVVALSMYEEADMIDRMRRAGAESYVLKTAPSEELLAAIHGQSPKMQEATSHA